MKIASSDLISLLGSSRQFIMADLWTFTLKNGTILNYTSWDNDLVVGGTTYKSHDVLLMPGKFKQTRGLEVNETDVMCYPSVGANNVAASMVGNIPFLQACVSGLLDRATAQRERLFMAAPGSVALDPVRIFLGEITNVTVTRNTAKLSCKDATNLLNTFMPWRQYQPTCPWTFGDSNCTVNRSALTVSNTASAGSTKNSILCSLNQVSGYFNYGTVTFTSGLNNGIGRAIKNYSPGSVALTGPFPQPIAPGDTFNITPGCSKNFGGPTQAFNGDSAYGSTPQIILNNLGAAAGAYNGYTITFTSGLLSGESQVISQWTPGVAVMVQSFTQPPSVNDTFNVVNNGVIVAMGQNTTPLSSEEIPTNLTNADGFFNGGTLQFTSGANVGQTQTVSNWAAGIATVSAPFPNVPAPGDTLTLTSINTATQSTCTGYSNQINFGGEPFVPVPETAY